MGGAYSNTVTTTQKIYDGKAQSTYTANGGGESAGYSYGTVFYNFAYNGLANIAKGGAGPKFIDSCTNARFHGKFEAYVPGDNRASKYKISEDIGNGNCLIFDANDTLAPAGALKLSSTDSRYKYGTKSGYYTYTPASAGHGGAVIITW